MGKIAQQAKKKPGEAFQDFSRQRRSAFLQLPIKKDGPGKKREDRDRTEKPKWLLVLEHRRQVTLEIVLKDEDVQEIGIASRAKHIPR